MSIKQPSRRIRIATCALLALAVFAVYHPVWNYDFIALDDPVHVSQNPRIYEGLSVEGLAWAFGVNHWSWHPVTFVSHMIDSTFYGRDLPGGHHMTNVVIHALNALLLLGVAFRLTGAFWRSAILAAVFALHPLRVESVAWVAERKDVLMCFFGLLAIWAYVDYVKRPTIARYVLVAILFALSLMSKAMFLTLPFVLLLLDYWPLGRLARLGKPAELEIRNQDETADGKTASENKVETDAPTDTPTDTPTQTPTERRIGFLILEKLPLLVLSAASAAMTIWAGSANGRFEQGEAYGLGTRMANVFVSYARYLETTFWPHDLALLYPYPPSWPVWLVAISCVVFAVVTAVSIWQFRKRPYLGIGWLWFVGTLIPVIGIVQLGAHARADRFTYMPSIGLLLAVVWLLGDLLRLIAKSAESKFQVGAVLGVVASIALGVLSYIQVQHWRDTPVIYSRTLDVTKDNWKMHYWYGKYLGGKGYHGRAIDAFENALKIRPDDPQSHEERASLLGVAKRTDEGIELYEKRVADRPKDAHARYCLALVYRFANRQEDSIAQLGKVLELDPKHVKAMYWIAGNLLMKGKTDEALTMLKKAHAYNPRSANVLHGLGLAYLRQGDTVAAGTSFEKALEINPTMQAALHSLADLRLGQRRPDEALELLDRSLALNPRSVRTLMKVSDAMLLKREFSTAMTFLRRAAEADPRDPRPLARLTLILVNAGRLPQAIEVCQLRLKNGVATANVHDDLGVIYAKMGKPLRAIKEFNKALKIDPDHKSARMHLEQIRKQNEKPAP